MKKICLYVLSGLIVFPQLISAFSVGIYNGDSRAAFTNDMAAALKGTGMTTGVFDKKAVTNGMIEQYDVLIFSGGWNAYAWAGYDARLRLADYVQRGHGVLLTGFRTGSVRSANRPVFPEIAQSYNKGNNNGVVVADRKHPITMDLPEKFLHAPWDHLLMLAGPAGSVLMQDNAGQP
ncbi:MAG: hypothetical protein PHW60_16200, partial [Kiritimatiellae bacterium]|nr:hypothetical protein [Kiritimatiellia bacterium]